MSARTRRNPSQLPELDWSALCPGDVLLSRGGAKTSDRICLIDRGDFSHASLWDGQNVLEATGTGRKVRASTLEVLTQNAKYVDAFRPHFGEQALGAPGFPADPLLKVARSYVGQRYSYGQLYLIGTLVALGRLTGHPSAQEILRELGGDLAEVLRQHQNRGANDQPMICSHFVSRCFWEADPSEAHTYALTVRYEPSAVMRNLEDLPQAEARGGERGARHASGAGLSIDEWRFCEELERGWRDLLGDEFAAAVAARQVPGRARRGTRALGVQAAEARAGSEDLPACCVTPADLQRSPSLRCLGTLHK